MTARPGADIPALMVFKAFAAGCASTRLGDNERAFFREARPCGLILFQRNCESPEQIRKLAEDAAAAAATSDEDPFLVLVDQEGGRVRRLRPPHWREFPSARAFGALYRQDRERGLEAARLCARLQAEDLRASCITMNCSPVLDIPVPGAHDIIGNRAYGDEPDTIIALARGVAEGYMAGGVVPVIKHVPGHGRARADSHESLPVIETPLNQLEASDFKPFAALSDMPAAMTAHLLLTALDKKRPVSISPVIIEQVIRRKLGFDGLLMSDDLSMKALDGTLAERTKSVISAGCDIALHCNGDLAEMEQVAAAAPDLSERSLGRLERAFAVTARCEAYDKPLAEHYIAQALDAEGGFA